MVKNAVEDILKLDIDDPTDFSHSSLQSLDSSLRCLICSNLFEGPVVLPCGHSFCSLCIRGAMADKAQCPTCRKEATEFHIKVNTSLEDAVVAWSNARPLVLELCQEQEEAREAAKRTNDHPTNTRPSKKRRVNPENDSIPGPSALTKRSQAPSTSKSKNDTKEVSDPERSSTPECVDCPMCQKSVLHSKINVHIDSGCKTGASLSRTSSGSGATLAAPRAVKRESAQKMEWAKLLDGRAKMKGKDKAKDVVDSNTVPLPKVSYSMLKDKRIRDYLAEWDLSTTGDKSALTARHQRWVMIYNANLDRGPTQRKQVPELRAEMKRWEDERKAVATGRKMSGKEAVKDTVEYQRVHKAEFDALIARARPQKSIPPISASDSSTPTPSTSVPTPQPTSSPPSWSQQRSSVTPEDDAEMREEAGSRSEAIVIDSGDDEDG
ncbi:uncharacterized protein STEHIDRAFT_74932 [Stereum hirsutum FP-91666 SS1]|uniref:uncharacterized protein n=1 Tax=Stereum hirsutum (strain FP-91666) TaxID=721885 RepID=UPI000440CEB9|nr:uncharacterized protein STEHIDRAFT_74932 [Stereum hirsutum FP-91666 SS1]EIM90270.1 hypothetical protein STEHIDRAFT_74932 [Stereum hirsutum FP-91666 SS1]